MDENGVFVQTYYGCASYTGGAGYYKVDGKTLIFRFDSSVIEPRIYCQNDSLQGNQISLRIIDILSDLPGAAVGVLPGDGRYYFADDSGHVQFAYDSGAITFDFLGALRGLKINPKEDQCNHYTLYVNLDPRITTDFHGQEHKFKRVKNKSRSGTTVYVSLRRRLLSKKRFVRIN